MKRNEFTAKELWLTVADASTLLNINPRSIRKLIDADRIDASVTVNKRERYLVRVDNFNSTKRERL